MAVDNSLLIKNNTDAGQLQLADGTGTPLTATVHYDNADWNLTGLTPTGRETVHYQGRGATRSVRQGERKPPSLSFSCQVAEITSATRDTAQDMIFGQGDYAARITRQDVPNDDVLLRVSWTMKGAASDGSEDQIVRCYGCGGWSVDLAEDDPCKFSFSCTVFGGVTVTVDGTTTVLVPGGGAVAS